MIPLVRITATIGVALSTALGSVFLPGSVLASAQAASSDHATVTWAVRPSDGKAADGRTAIEFKLGAGESAQDHLEVTNLSRLPAEFAISAADGYFTAQGRFNMLPSDQASVDAGTWIVFSEDSVLVDAGESVIVPFTITVPENATPGDHPAGIAASVTSTATAEDGTTMGVESRVGFRVMTRVTGELAPAISISDVSVRYDSSWHLARPGAIDVTYTAANGGNTRLEIAAAERASSPFSIGSADATEPSELFPGDERRLTARVSNVWPLGFATVTIEVTATPLPDSASTPAVTATEDVLVWTIPWLELLILAGLALLLAALFWGRRRQAAKVDRLVAEARRQFDADLSAPDSTR